MEVMLYGVVRSNLTSPNNRFGKGPITIVSITVAATITMQYVVLLGVKELSSHPSKTHRLWLLKANEQCKITSQPSNLIINQQSNQLSSRQHHFVFQSVRRSLWSWGSFSTRLSPSGYWTLFVRSSFCRIWSPTSI